MRYSSDGLNWGDEVSLPGVGESDCHANMIWSPELKKYVGILRHYDPIPVTGNRKIARTESIDSVTWTKSETIIKVILPSALPGIIGSFLLAISRAIGETMIVVMAAGLAANLTINPLESTTTITTQIVMILVGDQEFDSPKTQSAFALGLTLFIATLVLNYIAQRAVKKYREKYD